MEQGKTSLMKQAMTFGAIIGLALVVYSVFLYITGLTFNKALGLVQYVVLFTGIYLGIKDFRDKVLGGFITYGKALGLGVLISVFVGIITLFFNFLMMRFIDPGLIDKAMAVAEETLENNRFISADQLDDALERSRWLFTSVWSVPIGLISFSFIGFVISLITSAFVKRDPNPLA
jgi:hypothetical protein